MGEVLAAGIPNGEARLEAMEANGTDYFTWKALVTAFMAGYGKVTDATDAALVNVLTRLGVLEVAGNNFVAAGAISTADLLANYPPSSSLVGKYARVSDLFGAVDEIMRCRYDSVNYRWVPQRTDYNATVAAAGTINLIPLVTPPTVKTVGNLTGHISFAPSATNAYIGQRFRIVMTGGLGIYTATVTGLIGSNLTLLGNSSKDIEYSSGGWFAVAG